MPPRLRLQPTIQHITSSSSGGILCRRLLSASTFSAQSVTAASEDPSRPLSSSVTSQQQQQPPPPPPPPPSRWVSDVRARIGKCVQFGCDAGQIRRASRILDVLARDWLALSAGSEGFLVGERRGLERQQVVWGEMDSFGHVNNTVYLKYAEAARVNWIVSFGRHDFRSREAWADLMKPKTVGLIMKSITADFKFPMTAPDKVSAHHKLSIRPEADHTVVFLDCLIYSHRHRRVAARTTEEVAIYDYREARKTVLPDFALGVLQDTWQRQNEQAAQSRRRVWDLLAEVESLEKDTWDRADAVEDLGVAGG